MSELPKIAQDRLIKTYPGPHPEADLLAAFAEQSLAAAERERVLAHLAACADCREVVHLAMPPQEETQKVFAGTPSSQIFGWSRMRWGALAAGMAAVLTVAVFVQRDTQQEFFASKQADKGPALLAENQIKAQPEAKPADKTVNINAPASKVSSVMADSVQPLRGKNDAPAPPASAQIAAKPVLEARQNNLDQRSYGYAPMPQQTGSVGQSNAMSQNATQAQNQSKDQMQNVNNAGRVQTDALTATAGVPANAAEAEHQAMPVPAAPTTQSNESDLKKEAARKDELAAAKSEPLALYSSQKALAAEKSSDFKLPAEAKSASAHTSARSDDGSIWRIEQGALQLLGGMPQDQRDDSSLSLAKKKTRIEADAETADAWRRVRTARDVPLNAIAVLGKDIWVGGANGSLQHSPDNGKSWAELHGPWPPDTTIVSLRFRDQARGELRTAAGERWSTDDGGTTWRIKH